MAPAKGWPTPQRRFWIANAMENTSRPQPCANDSGVRNWPTAERGPKLNSAIKQPQKITTAGVRQVSAGDPADDVVVDMMLVPRPARPNVRAVAGEHSVAGPTTQINIADRIDLRRAWLN